MAENTNTEAAQPSAPPYISFRTLLNLIERMADQGVPRRIDRSFLTGLSGGYQTQVMAALRFLGLMSEDGDVQPALLDLINQPKVRKDLMGQILRARYAEAVQLGEQNATQAELEAEFKKSGISGATLRKAVAFYLHAARFADIPVSPFFSASSASETRTTTRRRKARTPRVPPADPESENKGDKTTDLRTRYVEMLM